MRFPVRTEVARPAADVLVKLSDCRNEERWNSQVTSANHVGGADPPEVGTRFNTVNRGKHYDATLTVQDAAADGEPGRIVFDVVGKPMDITASYSLTAAGEGTLVEGELDMRPKGFLRLLMPMLRGSIQKDLDAQYASFARFCESS